MVLNLIFSFEHETLYFEKFNSVDSLLNIHKNTFLEAFFVLEETFKFRKSQSGDFKYGNRCSLKTRANFFRKTFLENFFSKFLCRFGNFKHFIVWKNCLLKVVDFYDISTNGVSANNVDIFWFIRPEKDSQEKTCAEVSFSVSLQAWPTTWSQKRLHHRCKMFKGIYFVEHLRMAASGFWTRFVDLPKFI